MTMVAPARAAGKASFVPFSPPAIATDELAEVIGALKSGWLSTGPRVRRFEAAFARYVGAPHGVAVASHAEALRLSLLDAGIGAGDEVITTPLAFAGTANAIVDSGATPVFADVDAQTGNLDPDAVAAAVTPKTRAILATHYAGRPADVEAFRRIARRHGLVTIEDASYCVEGTIEGRKIGATADYTCFSFPATRQPTTQRGGVVTTLASDSAARIRASSVRDITPDESSTLDVHAAVGLHQLVTIDCHHQRRVAICERYDDAFDDLGADRFADVPEGTVHARHLYMLLFDPRVGFSRDDAAAELARAGIASSVHFPAIHLHPFYARRYGFARGQCPHAERIANRVLSLPLSAALTDEQVDAVIAVVGRILGARS